MSLWTFLYVCKSLPEEKSELFHSEKFAGGGGGWHCNYRVSSRSRPWDLRWRWVWNDLDMTWTWPGYGLDPSLTICFCIRRDIFEDVFPLKMHFWKVILWKKHWVRASLEEIFEIYQNRRKSNTWHYFSSLVPWNNTTSNLFYVIRKIFWSLPYLGDVKCLFLKVQE